MPDRSPGGETLCSGPRDGRVIPMPVRQIGTLRKKLVAGKAAPASMGCKWKKMKAERFEPFLKENEKRIHNYLLRFLEVDDDAQDLLQNIFIAFYDRLGEIEEKTATAYLYRMAHNMALNWIKQRKRFILKAPADFANLRDTSQKDPPPDYAFLNRAVRELPVRLSTVIHLQYYENLSYKEISARLGISVKAVESLLVRAKKLLRKKIIKETGGESVSSYGQQDPARAG